MNKQKASIKKEKLICPGCKGDFYDSSLTKTLGRKVWLWGTIKAPIAIGL